MLGLKRVVRAKELTTEAEIKVWQVVKNFKSLKDFHGELLGGNYGFL